MRPCRTGSRFIPTHVGNRAVSKSSCRIQAVHPHARGEQALAAPAPANRRGSSPRTWGTGTPCRAPGIPVTVHPHARGEQIHRHHAIGVAGGSSPRTWGTAAAVYDKILRQRFIPTHVGNSSAQSPRPGWSSVHPHARGEQSFWVIAPDSRIGSSPRTWGTGELSAVRAASSRFIPTHVGNSWGIMGMPCGMAVHPHARGEQSSAPSPASAPRGSSPRTWGTASFRILCQTILRFIPTHVGNSSSVPARSR